MRFRTLIFFSLCMGLLASCGKDNQNQKKEDPEEKPTATRIKLVSYNILEGMEYDVKNNWSNFCNWIKEQDPDVMCYVEACLNDDEFASICERIGHEHHYMSKVSASYPVAISSRYPIKVVETELYSDSKLRGAFWVRIQGVNFVPLHLYYKQSLDGDEIRKTEMTAILKKTISAHPELKWVMCGDFNDQTKDDGRWSNLNPSRKYELHEMIRKAGYKDCIRIMNPDDWCRTMQTDAYAGTGGTYRLDYIYATEELADCMSAAGRIKDSFTDNASDHYPVYTVFDMTKLKY